MVFTLGEIEALAAASTRLLLFLLFLGTLLELEIKNKIMSGRFLLLTRCSTSCDTDKTRSDRRSCTDAATQIILMIVLLLKEKCN